MREDFKSESEDNLPVWSRQDLAQAKESLLGELYALPKEEIHTRSRGPAYVLHEGSAIWYFHVIETVGSDIHIRSEPLSDLNVKNVRDAALKAADRPNTPRHVKGYSLEVLVAWGGSPDNVESLYAAVATADQARLERLQQEVASKILELRSLSAVRDWLLQEQKEIVSSVTLQA